MPLRGDAELIMMDPVDGLLAAHGFSGAWTRLNAGGFANRVYATADVVLPLATDHPEAVEGARTESVAAVSTKLGDRDVHEAKCAKGPSGVPGASKRRKQP
jgi:hypothetical protein